MAFVSKSECFLYINVMLECVYYVEFNHRADSLEANLDICQPSYSLSERSSLKDLVWLIQALISICLTSNLVLHGRGVIAWLHCLCPKLKVPKAFSLSTSFVQALTTSECVSLSHLSLYKPRGVRHSSASSMCHRP